MNHLYADLDHGVTINLIDLTWTRPNMWVVGGVDTDKPFRSQGHARNLFAQVLEDADREGVTLLLAVVYVRSDKGLSEDELHFWYGRLGFVYAPKFGANAMIRIPQNQMAVQT